MSKTYITFGQAHTHRVHGKTFDCDSVAVIEAPGAIEGRKRAVELFGDKFCFSYHEEQFSHDKLKYFPRGLIDV